MTKVTAGVYVVDTTTSSGYRFIRAGEEVTEPAIAAQIGDHLWEGGKRPEVDTDDDTEVTEKPAKTAKVAVWRSYAEHLGLEVGESATKDALIAAVEEHEATTGTPAGDPDEGKQPEGGQTSDETGNGSGGGA